MTTNLSAQAAAAAVLAAKGPKAKADLVAYIAAKATASKRLRWQRLHTAVLAGDKARIAYYAATGEAKGEALKALKPVAKAEPKPEPKPAPKAAPAKAAKPKAVAAPAKGRAPKTVSAPNPQALDARMAELMAAAHAAGLHTPELAAAFVSAFMAVKG